jgi:hypothetical protein
LYWAMQNGILILNYDEKVVTLFNDL